jgi:hypothetical protein
MITAILPVFYQVFSSDGAIRSKCAFRENDPYTGRVIATRITPPHTAQTVKKFICKEEGIADIEGVDLLTSLTSNLALNDQDNVPILAHDGPGTTVDNPVVIVVKLRPSITGKFS